MKRIISITTAVLLVLGSYSLCFAGGYASYTLTASGASSSSNPNGSSFFATSNLVGSTFTFTVTHANNEWRSISNVSSSAGYFTVTPVSNCYIDNGQLLWTDKSVGLLASFTVEVLAFNASASFSISDSCSAWDYYLGLPAPAVTSSYSLPCGNTIYIDLGSSGASYNLSFDAIYNTKLGILNDTWPNSHYYVFANTIPQTTSAFTPSTGTYITMYKGDDRDLLGQTYKGTGSIEGTSTGQYLVIVNPLMYAQTTNIYNPVLTISGIPEGTTIYTYPVSSSIVGSEVMSEITSTAGGIGTASSSGGAITTYSTDDNSVVYVPNAGGNTVVDVHNYVDDALSSIEQTLSNFTQSVSGVLSAPIGHINQLISSGSNFFQHLSGLWSWLPSEVVATISGALSLVVTVAIFKVFL